MGTQVGILYGAFGTIVMQTTTQGNALWEIGQIKPRLKSTILVPLVDPNHASLFSTDDEPGAARAELDRLSAGAFGG